MKHLFPLLFTVISFAATAQSNFKKDGHILYSKSTIVINTDSLHVGDTVYLQFGSGANKDFLFASYRPVLFAFDITKGIEPLPSGYANMPLILKQIAIEKLSGMKYSDGIFNVPGNKTKICVDLYNAVQSGEVRLSN
jgi:hypothetical protein